MFQGQTSRGEMSHTAGLWGKAQ